MTVSNHNRPRLSRFAALNLLVAVLLATGIATYQVGRFWEHHMAWWFCLFLGSMAAVLMFWRVLMVAGQRMQKGRGPSHLGFPDITQALTLGFLSLILVEVLAQQLLQVSQWLLALLFCALLHLSIIDLPRHWQAIRQARSAMLLRKR